MTSESTPPAADRAQTSAVGEQAGRYIVWILSAFVVNISITCFLTYVVELSPQASFAISLVVITIVNFFGLRHFVYRVSQSPIRQQIVGYVVTNGFQRSLEYGMLHGVYVVADPPVYLVVPVVLAISTLMRFFVYRRFVFKEPISATTCEATADSLPT